MQVSATWRAFVWMLLAVIAALPGIARADDAPTRLDTAGLVPDAPLSKRMHSLRDMRYRDLVRQGYDFSCGTAALATVLRYGYGIDVSEAGLIKQMLTKDNAREVLKSGFSMLDMKQYVEKHGMRAHGFRIEPQSLYQLQIPVIALMEVNGYRHFVVVKGAAAGRVMVADPAMGHRVVYERDFVKGWNGIVLAVVAEAPFRTDSWLARDRQSNALALRGDALGRVTAPVPLVELGLVRADLF